VYESSLALAAPSAVTGDERLAEVGLPGEVVMQGSFGDLQLGCDVGVAEAIEAADLDQPLGYVQDPRGRPGLIAYAPASHQIPP
jgi:hypothetical protein